MRTKNEILKDSNNHLRKAPNWDGTASLHERLTIEVLIDIRDILNDLNKSFGSNILDLARES